jgi:SAM-dependent methyltransferase
MLSHKKISNKNNQTYLKKELIQLIYQNYYRIIKKNIYNKKSLPVFEFGSGGNNIKKIIPNCIVTENFKTKNIDRIENIYKINCKNNSISNIILIDVFHHLEFPSLALSEINRVLVKNGRLIMIEPAMGLIPRIIYKMFHYEPNGFNLNIKWNKIPSKIPKSKEYYAAQSLPWRAFFLKELNLKKFRIKIIKPFSDFAFLLSGGYSYRSLYPHTFYPFIKYIDKILTFLSIRIFSGRMLIILENKNYK